MAIFGRVNRHFSLLTLILSILASPAFAIKHTPVMVNVPGGLFKQGCVSGRECDPDEKPVKKVKVAPFSISKYEITFDQWDECFKAKGCRHNPKDMAWGRGDRPVINISFKDIRHYLSWLSKEKGREYRLPTETEWEYAARAGAKSKYWWGNQRPVCSNKKINGARFDSGTDTECPTQTKGEKEGTKTVGQYKPNRWNIHDIHGNVWEMTSGCYTENYRPNEFANCYKRVIRGGAWSSKGEHLRLANRGRAGTAKRAASIGFRVVSAPIPNKKVVIVEAKEPEKKKEPPPPPAKPKVIAQPKKEDVFETRSREMIKRNNAIAKKIGIFCSDGKKITVESLVNNLTMGGKEIVTDLYNIAHTSEISLKAYKKQMPKSSDKCVEALNNMSSFLINDRVKRMLSEHRAGLNNEDID